MTVFINEKWKILWGKKINVNTFEFGTRQKKKLTHLKSGELYSAASK